MHPAVRERLGRLAGDQRAAATAPRGPVLCVAPAGSGKTTTLVARVAWLVATGVDPANITVLAFNRRAAEELSERLSTALEPLGMSSGVRVRTFHALGLEVLREAGRSVEPLVDRDTELRHLFPDRGPAERTALDLAFSRLKLDLRVSAEEVARDPERGPMAQAFVEYEEALRARGGLDFDDLVARALRLLEDDEAELARWRARCSALLVDEAQDLDRSQLSVALLLAAPANDVFLVGDDDQTIYGWRLADVRRVLGLAALLPGLRRVDLTVNYRCPGVVVERAVRLVETNRERFAKRIAARPGAAGPLVLAPDAGDDVERIGRVLRGWPDDGGTSAVLARTNRELRPAAIVALELGIPFRVAELQLLFEDARIDAVLDAAARLPDDWPLLVRLGRVMTLAMRGELGLDAGPRPPPGADTPGPAERLDDPEGRPGEVNAGQLFGSVLAWAARFDDLLALRGALEDRRIALARLRVETARLTLATAHATKGAEWDHVLVLTDGFPARRAVATATDPAAVLEEERRLAYVAWTRARRSLTLLYDPAAPSPFLREAFDAAELGVETEEAA